MADLEAKLKEAQVGEALGLQRKAYISLLKEIKLGGIPSSQRARRAEGAISTSSSLMPKTVL